MAEDGAGNGLAALCAVSEVVVVSDGGGGLLAVLRCTCSDRYAAA